MKSAAILAAGIVALALLAALCLPRHFSPSTALGPVIPANFHARVEHGVLFLRGSLPSETSRATILQRAQELYGTLPGDVIDELAVDPRLGPVVWADNVSQVLPVLGHMTERGAIIIDGRTIVVSGQVSGDRLKTAVLEAIAPLTQTGLELEDRILTNPASVGPSPKGLSPAVQAKRTSSQKSSLLTTASSLKTIPSQTSGPLAAPSPKHPSLQATQSLEPLSLAGVRSSSLQQSLNEILARGSIEFKSNSTTMTSDSVATLDQLIDQLRHAPRIPIEIGGHTDKYGEPNYNIQLSRRRAEAVRRYFVSHGLINQFTAVGYGASRPLSAAENRAGLQRNRRIELRVKGPTDL